MKATLEEAVHANVRNCVTLAVELCHQTDDGVTDGMSIFISRLLNAITPHAAAPTYEQYNEVLPKSTTFGRDIEMRETIKQRPVVWQVGEA